MVTLGATSILEQDVVVDFQGKLRARSVFAFGGLPLPEPGTLLVEVVSAAELIHSYEVKVNPAPEPPTPVVTTS
jgi:hypothetical protein